MRAKLLFLYLSGFVWGCQVDNFQKSPDSRPNLPSPQVTASPSPEATTSPQMPSPIEMSALPASSPATPSPVCPQQLELKINHKLILGIGFGVFVKCLDPTEIERLEYRFTYINDPKLIVTQEGAVGFGRESPLISLLDISTCHLRSDFSKEGEYSMIAVVKLKNKEEIQSNTLQVLIQKGDPKACEADKNTTTIPG